jgi:adenylate kinase
LNHAILFSVIDEHIGDTSMDLKARYLILLGPPMSGKGTQAARLSEIYGIPPVSSGDLFRYNIKNRTQLGIEAKSYIDRGDLVPDQVTIGMVSDRLKQADLQNGAILDGFPRTVPQAEALDKILSNLGAALSSVLFITVPDEILVERASGRRICRRCGHAYHLTFHPPEQEGVCDQDEGELYQREDDNPDTVRQRLAVYISQTSPLIDFYQERGILKEIDGNQPIEKVSEKIAEVIEK